MTWTEFYLWRIDFPGNSNQNPGMSLIALCGIRLSSVGGNGALSTLAKEKFVSFWVTRILILHFLMAFTLAVEAQTNVPEATVSPVQAADLQQLNKVSQQIQEQLQILQRELVQDREASQIAAGRNAQALSNGLYALEQALTTERARELETWHASSQALQRSNRAMLVLAGALAGVGFLTLLVLTWSQWRTTRQLSEFSGLLAMNRVLRPASDRPQLSAGDGPGSPTDPVGNANQRLMGALEQLDQRIRELKGAMGQGNGSPAPTVTHVVGSEADDPSRIPVLLEQAGTLLKADNTEAALACFDEILLLAPNHAEALVKKGAVLERMHKLNEAIACYDRAIAADNSLTFAYLHKGGLCSRLERFKEALECYEKALLTHEQK
jgi:tetratricopeptide (TPR) repeat protein